MERWLPLGGFLISFAAFVIVLINTRHGRRRESATDWQKQINDAIKPFEKIPEIVAEIRAEQLVHKKQLEIFWRGVKYGSSEALISPHTPELDELLRRFQSDELRTDDERRRLRHLLRQLRDDQGETIFRRKMANDVLTLIKIEEIGCQLRSSLNEQDEQFSSDIRGLSRRLEH